MGAPLIAGMSQAEWDRLVGSAQSARDQLAQTGTFNGKTGNQNLAAVIQQPGNTTKTTATPYINSSGQTDYHISGQPDTGSGQNKIDVGVDTSKNISAPPVGTTTPTGMNQAMSQMPTYVPPAAQGLNFDQATSQVRGQIDPMFARALEALQAQKYQDQLNGDQLGMARGGSHSGLAADLQNKVAIGAAGKAADLDATRQTQIAEMAQALVNRGEDNDYRNKQAALAEYLGINGLNLQQQGQNFNQGIQQGELTGIYKGMDTLAKQQQNYNQSASNPNNIGQNLQNQLTQLQLNDYPAQSQAAAQKTQQDLAAGKISNDVAKYQFDELKNPNSAVNQANAIDLQIKKLDLANYSQKQQLEIQQLQKQIAQIGVVHYKPQTAAEIAQDKVTLATATQQLKDIESGKVPVDNTKINQLMEVWKNTGLAPAGLESLGVEKNTPFSQKPVTTSYKEDPDFKSDAANMVKNPLAARTELRDNSQAYIDKYGIDGYNALISVVNK